MSGGSGQVDTALGNLDVRIDLTVANDASVARDSTVGRDSTIGRTEHVGADLHVGTTCAIGDDCTVGGQITVTGAGTFGSTVTAPSIVSTGSIEGKAATFDAVQFQNGVACGIIQLLEVSLSGDVAYAVPPIPDGYTVTATSWVQATTQAYVNLDGTISQSGWYTTEYCIIDGVLYITSERFTGQPITPQQVAYVLFNLAPSTSSTARNTMTEAELHYPFSGERVEDVITYNTLFPGEPLPPTNKALRDAVGRILI